MINHILKKMIGRKQLSSKELEVRLSVLGMSSLIISIGILSIPWGSGAFY